MAIQTKAQLSASNNTAFPDNNTGYITPEILRGFNTASIDSYAALSGSNVFVGNQVITGSVIATSFTGSLQGTSSWANNSTTASYALTATSSSYALNATNAVSATSASYALSSSQAANATSASYALTASFANTANAVTNVTQSGNVVYAGLTGYMDNMISKVTGSFNIVSGSFTKILSISSSTAMAINMNTYFAIVGATPDEIGYQQYAGYLRPGSLSNIVVMPAGNGSSQNLINPSFSASFNSGIGYVDVYARNSYGGVTSSVIIDMTVASANPITIA